jgi:DNA recombination protein RmuC
MITNIIFIGLFTFVIVIMIFLIMKYLNDIKTKQLEIQNQMYQQQQKFYTENQQSITGQLNTIIKTVNENLSSNQLNINAQLSATSNTVKDVFNKLGVLEQTAKNIQDIGKDISSLQDILQAPKLRGNLGEFLLEDLLKQIFPKKNYIMKYSFKNGTQVDAVIKIGDGIVPVDSKFPLESFQRFISTENEEEKTRIKKEFAKSVKLRIDEIADKYINPNEKTFDFALMYIPAENVFYEIIINDAVANKEFEIFKYAISRHVIPVSPNSFYAYLMAIAYGLKGFQIEAQAKTIIGDLGKVKSDFDKFFIDFQLVGKHIENAGNKYKDCEKRADYFSDKVARLTNLNLDDGSKEIEDKRR